MHSQIIQQGEALIRWDGVLTKQQKEELEKEFYEIFKLKKDGNN